MISIVTNIRRSVKWALLLFGIWLFTGLAIKNIQAADSSPTPSKDEITKIAKCLRDKQFTMYGTSECSACAIQKGYFAEEFTQVPYIDCDKERNLCDRKKIFAYPTWEDKEGQQYKGAIPIQILGELSGCSTAEPANELLGIKQEQVFAAFFAGLLSFLAPCLIPLLPAYFSTITGFTFSQLYGLEFDRLRSRIIISALFFVAGFTLVYSVLGATGSFVGQLLNTYLPVVLRISGIYLVVLGLIQLEIIRINSLRFDYAWNIQKRLANLGYISATVTGIAAGFSWIPCVGPLLSSVLLLAAKSQSVISGIILLFIYSMGLTLPFMIAALFFPVFIKNYQEKKNLFHKISLISGVFIVIFGAVLMFGQYGNILAKYRLLIAAIKSFFLGIELW